MLSDSTTDSAYYENTYDVSGVVFKVDDAMSYEQCAVEEHDYSEHLLLSTFLQDNGMTGSHI